MLLVFMVYNSPHRKMAGGGRWCAGWGVRI